MNMCLLGIVNSYKTSNKSEQQHVIRIRKFLASETDHYDRHNSLGHVTGSALVMDVSTGRILLHYHKTLHRWLQFGGHTEGETDPADTAFREAREETGLHELFFFPDSAVIQPIDIDVHIIPKSDEMPEHLHYDVRYLLGTTQSDTVRPNSRESQEFRWIYPEKIHSVQGLDEGLERLANKASKIYEQEMLKRESC